MARSRASTQTNPSETGNAKTAKTPAPKLPTPAKATSRRSPASPPASPTCSLTTSKMTAARKSQIPAPLQFPLVVFLSFTLSTLLYSLVAEITTGDLAGISKRTESWFDVAGLLLWRVIQIAACWFGNLDAYDMLSLSLLISTPTHLLTYLFYAIRPSTILATLFAFTLSSVLPIALLRPASPSHHPHTAPRLPNRPILTDPYTTLATCALAAAIFATLLQASFATFLPTFLITNFGRLRDVSAAHAGAAGLPTLLLSLLPAGYAAYDFLFVPSTAAVTHSTGYAFSPATSGLAAYIYHNVWGWYSARQKQLIGRTALLAALVVGETVLQTWGTIEGVELRGAIGYAGMWGLSVAVVGAVFDWVGGPSG